MFGIRNISCSSKIFYTKTIETNVIKEENMVEAAKRLEIQSVISFLS